MTFGDLADILPFSRYIAIPLSVLLSIGIWCLGLWIVWAIFSKIFSGIFSLFGGKPARKTTRRYDAEYYPKPSNEPKTNKGVLSTAARTITHNYAADQYKADQKRVERKNSPEYGSKSIFGSSDNIFD